MPKTLRKGKVLIDWSQNDEHKTTVNVYSLRARERPAVSTPVTWQEVKNSMQSGDPNRLEGSYKFRVGNHCRLTVSSDQTRRTEVLTSKARRIEVRGAFSSEAASQDSRGLRPHKR